MNPGKLAADYGKYLRDNPQAKKTPQIVEWLITRGSLIETPEITHLNLTFDIRDNKVIRVNPDISFKVV